MTGYLDRQLLVASRYFQKNVSEYQKGNASFFLKKKLLHLSCRFQIGPLNEDLSIGTKLVCAVYLFSEYLFGGLHARRGSTKTKKNVLLDMPFIKLHIINLLTSFCQAFVEFGTRGLLQFV